MSALRGDLRDFGIAEVFQLIGQQRKTGVLEIDHSGSRVQLVFDGGAVVSAAPVTGAEDGALADMLLRCGLITRETLLELQREMETSLRRLVPVVVDRDVMERDSLAEVEDLLTQETLFRVLRWSSGSFSFDAGPVEHDRARRLLAAEQILMDGLRMVDEWRTFADEVPSEETVFQRTGRFEDWPAARDGEGRPVENARRVFQLVDGRLSARRVIDLSRMGTFEATRILTELRRAGLIEPLDPSQVPRAHPQVGFELHRPSPRPLLAGALPLLLLAALVFSALRTPKPVQPDDGFALARAPLAQARGAFETERVRKALEAYRFSRGYWPERLDDLAVEGFLDRDALTPSSGHPYYYGRPGDDAVLLAPEQ